MNRSLSVYADVEAFFDYRRGLLQCLMTDHIEDPDQRKAEGDRLWDLYIARNYRDRKFDTYNYTHIGIDAERFKAIHAQRSLAHWATGMYYPTKLISTMVARIIDIEGLTEKPMDIKEVKLFVNTWPYQFDEEHIAELVEFIRVGLRGLVQVQAFSSDPAKHDAKFYGQYNYVFRYNLLLDETCEALMNSFQANPIPETNFVVPDVLVRPNDTFAGEHKDWMMASLLMMAPAIKLLPIEHSLYDYV
jgi:hypothetical protein